MRPKATPPLFSSAPHSIHLILCFSSPLPQLKAPSDILRVRPKLEVSLTHHIYTRGTGQGVPSKHVLKKHFKRIR
ncbi:hypothetical protein N7449_008024 [Penicillium cf. viridicatum]|uniref:Uncharacterized protein n=1 Tax=Penicillium cf. viridicatum TaxID=2972119 RepID=A0A9W9MCL7_9EURO|nr:hypothetical protein N7449_008024 [Penicillium cf. viridicatum]